VQLKLELPFSPPNSAWPAAGTPELFERGARVAAVEIAATGLHWTFSPLLCIARDLRWGRVNETWFLPPFEKAVQAGAEHSCSATRPPMGYQ
jgi:beta-glucosidase-like glycosyl hydrolase